MCRGHGLLYRLDTFCYFLCLERFGEEALTAPAASGMTAALAEIRSLQVDLIRLLLLFGNNDGKTDREQQEDHEMYDGRDDIGFTP